MDYSLIVALVIAALVSVLVIKKLLFNENSKAQRMLDQYLKKDLSPQEVGRAYERYIGYLYESEGYDVVYNGALKGYADMGRDLIVRSYDEVLIIQAKCWAKYKNIPEKDIFQLYGSAAHFHLTDKKCRGKVKPIFYTSANFSTTAKEAAKVLDIELIHLNLKMTYPMIKCRKTASGDMTYHMPFDTGYDEIKINTFKDDHFVSTVKEAVQKGFKRAA